MATRKIAIVVGSLRKESFSRKLARAMMEMAPAGLEMEIVEIRDLPLYNEDDETASPPPAFTAFRDRIRAADAILFVTPEYNRSIPAALKNAIDVGSRPYGKAAWTGKPCAIVSQSPGALGGFGANHHLRQTLPFLNMPAMPAPEAYLGGIAAKFDGERLADESLRGFLQSFVDSFAAWIERHAA
ncbi:NAD(P)H-dependent oxidoreductase [Massilia sp. Dwa41.01b]|uniref:NADPH-dependent FMN reductase n=1 Tax=unclassified Massilia TaxID=2609279 RepID=UPI00160470E6|nr:MULTISPECIES: NAD(P)H-dependent oxidoreductase [unclassified Massilia]QNA89682.1 NAD(P)H-dependent oxidoreductase [Massilia sp. Dwa41.01b]QNB00577.1 NAD(P)H-dependent oxidoreductase [Massilia sp. Se16.2.3]